MFSGVFQFLLGDIMWRYCSEHNNGEQLHIITNVCLHETVGNAFGKHENDLNAEYEGASILCFSKWDIIDPYTRIMKEW